MMYRTDLENYLDLFFCDGYVEWNDEFRFREIVEFTHDERRLVDACFSVVDRLRKDRAEDYPHVRKALEREFRNAHHKDIEDLNKQLEEHKEELSIYKDFYHHIRTSVQIQRRTVAQVRRDATDENPDACFRCQHPVKNGDAAGWRLLDERPLCQACAKDAR